MRSRAEIERQVSQLLAKHGIVAPAIAVEAIASAEGVPVIASPFRGDISGALIRSAAQVGIAVNASHPVNRQRFTIAHELAHYLLEHKGEHDHIDWKFTVLRRDGKSSEATDEQEMEANFFAASLLMPRSLIKQDLELRAKANGEADLQEGEIRSLALRYKVSERAMTYRLMNLGLITPV